MFPVEPQGFYALRRVRFPPPPPYAKFRANRIKTIGYETKMSRDTVCRSARLFPLRHAEGSNELAASTSILCRNRDSTRRH